jgi:hypothetical protein
MGTLADFLGDGQTTAPSTKRGQPTKESMLGYSDLADTLKQLKATTPQLVSGSAMHQDNLASIAEAEKALTRAGVQPTQTTPQSAPQTGTLADFIDMPATTGVSGGSGRGGQGGPTAAELQAYKPPLGPVAQAFQRALQLKQRAPGETAAVLDVVGNLPSQFANTAQYGIARMFGLSPEEATAEAKPLSQALANPFGRLTGTVETPGYQGSLPNQALQAIGGVVSQGAQAVGQRTGINPTDIEQGVNAAMMATPFAAKPVKAGVAKIKAALPEYTVEVGAPGTAGSVGAAAVPTETTIKAALASASPELQKVVSNIPPNKVNVPVLQRHIEADSLPEPVRLTNGQATGNVSQLSMEQNRRGVDPELAARFNEQNGQLVKNLDAIRETAAPDAYGTKTIENSDSLINTYKELDSARNDVINQKFQKLRDANGGEFPIDAPTLLDNVKASLKKELLSNDAPVSQMAELSRMAAEKSMTLEDYLSLRRNLGDIARTSTDGTTRRAASLMIQELENLPLQDGAKQVKPLADDARAAAKARFQMLEKDPAYKAAVEGNIPPDKFMEKFVINGTRDNVQTMIDQLGRDSVAHQHMSAGTLNWLREKAVDSSGNFSQAAFNKALNQLDKSQKLNLVFNPDASSTLKTLGNVAQYTQAQPKGSFVNNSNTLVGAMAERAAGGLEAAANAVGGGKFGIPVGSMIRGQVQKFKAAKETKKALEPAAGVTSLKDIGK